MSLFSFAEEETYLMGPYFQIVFRCRHHAGGKEGTEPSGLFELFLVGYKQAFVRSCVPYVMVR